MKRIINKGESFIGIFYYNKKEIDEIIEEIDVSDVIVEINIDMNNNITYSA